jgi:amidohydrolase
MSDTGDVSAGPLFDLDFLSWLVNLRRRFHRHPEPSFEEHGTQRMLMEVLNSIGVENHRIAKTGVLGSINGRESGRTIALRADMDALRIREPETELNHDYRSQNEGVMHACGHDGHMAILLGVAKLLNERRAELPGAVRLVFQPAEEIPPGGARDVIADGGLREVDAVLGLHLRGDLPVGRIAFRPGPMFAMGRMFELAVKGKPGHHMCPQDCVDPVQIVARFVSTIHSDIKQKLAPGDRYALGFGSIRGGAQFNQTPDAVTLTGTYRAFESRVASVIDATIGASLDSLTRLFAVAGATGTASYEMNVQEGYPALVNDPRFCRRAAEVLRQRFSDVDDGIAANFGSEDFARYLEVVPGMFSFLGAGNSARGIDAVNHSDRFDIDESVLTTGVELLVSLTTDFLTDPSRYLGF